MSSFARSIRRRAEQETRRAARREMRGQETRIMYHGTSAASFAALRDVGWQPPEDRAGPYVTDDPELARQYAARAAAAHMQATGSRDGRAVVFKLRLLVAAIELDESDDTGRQFIVPAGIPPAAIVDYAMHDFSHIKAETRHTLAASAAAAAGIERAKAAPHAAIFEMTNTAGAPAVGSAIPDAGQLIRAVMGIRLLLSEAAQPVGYGLSHGVPHWKRVAANGLRLLRAGEPGDPAVVLLFAILHDAMRETDESREPGHGDLAVSLARYLNGAAVDWLPDECEREVLPTPPPITFLAHDQLELLTRAIEDDDLATTSADSTIAVCLDADRLDVWRAGVKPDLKRLSTGTARRHEQSMAALEALGQPLTWASIFTGYSELSSGDRVLARPIAHAEATPARQVKRPAPVRDSRRERRPVHDDALDRAARTVRSRLGARSGASAAREAARVCAKEWLVVLGIGRSRIVVAAGAGYVAKIGWHGQYGQIGNLTELAAWRAAPQDVRAAMCPSERLTTGGVLIQQRAEPLLPPMSDPTEHVAAILAEHADELDAARTVLLDYGITDVVHLNNWGRLDDGRLVAFDYALTTPARDAALEPIRRELQADQRPAAVKA